MSQLYLLDTNVVLALVRGGELGAFIDATFCLRANRLRQAVSVVTHGEVRSLARRRGWGEAKLTALQDALDALVTVDINVAEVIDAYVDIDVFSSRYTGGARNMGKNDLWIAACAKAAGATLLTTDKDFVHLNPAMVDVRYIDPGSTLDTGSKQ